jgi:hypothetical protein
VLQLLIVQIFKIQMDKSQQLIQMSVNAMMGGSGMKLRVIAQ